MGTLESGPPEGGRRKVIRPVTWSDGPPGLGILR